MLEYIDKILIVGYISFEGVNNMIYESYYWKNELYKNYRLIVKFISPKYRKDKHFIDLEKAIMISAYIIRKLDDAAKIPSYILNNEINIKKYIANKKIIDIMNWQRIEENYKLENEFEYKDNWRYFINQIIHSFTFIPIFDDNNRFTGIMLNSDKTKNDTLFYICISEIIKGTSKNLNLLTILSLFYQFYSSLRNYLVENRHISVFICP